MKREVTVTEAAHVHSVSTKTIERWRKDGSIEARRVGRRWLYTVDVSDMADMSPIEQDTTLPVPLDPRAEEMLSTLSSMATGQAEIASKLESVLSCMMEQADEIAALRADLAYRDRPLWRRVFFRRRK